MQFIYIEKHYNSNCINTLFRYSLNCNSTEAMSSGGTAADWANIEEPEIRKRKEQWDKLKTLRDNEEIS